MPCKSTTTHKNSGFFLGDDKPLLENDASLNQLMKNGWTSSRNVFGFEQKSRCSQGI